MKTTPSKNGQYITIEPTPESKRWIMSLIKKLNPEQPVEEKDLHITLTYSETNGNTEYKAKPEELFNVQVSHFDFFGDNQECLVVVLNSENLKEKHKQLQKEGFEHSYSEYNPHVTLAFDYKNKNINHTLLLDENNNKKTLSFYNEQVSNIVKNKNESKKSLFKIN